MTTKIPFRKQVAKVGVWVDQSGQVVELSHKMLADFAKSASDMIERGFRMQCYSSHETVDTKDILGTYEKLEFDPETQILDGVGYAKSDKNFEVLQGSDASIIFIEKFYFDGDIWENVIVRIDCVGQGAVSGLGEYQRLSGVLSAFGMAQGKIKVISQKRQKMQDEKEKKEGEMPKGLSAQDVLDRYAAALSIEDSSPENMNNMLLNMSGAKFGMTDAEMLEQVKGCLSQYIEGDKPAPKLSTEQGDDEPKADVEKASLEQKIREYEESTEEELVSELSGLPSQKRHEILSLYRSSALSMGAAKAKRCVQSLISSSLDANGRVSALGAATAKVIERPAGKKSSSEEKGRAIGAKVKERLGNKT